MATPNYLSHQRFTRRDFLRGMATGSVAVATFPAIIPCSALGNGGVAPGNRICVGVIGCGPQGRGDMGNFLNEKNCQVVAVCDVKEDQLVLARDAVNKRYNTNYALGFVAGWGIHPLDIAAWGAGDLMNGPFTVEGHGNFRLAEGICDTATIWEVDYRFASGLTMKFVGVPNGANAGKSTGEPFLHGEEWKHRYRRISDHGTAFEGADGWAHVDRSGINLQPEDLIDRNPDDFKVKLIRSGDHVGNFIGCVKSRAETVCPIEAAVRSDILCHTADIALRLGRKVTFDFNEERFLHDEEANRRLKARPMRAPWHL